MTKREPLSPEPYKGVTDFYPEDWAKMQALFDGTRRLLRSYGFEEYNASPLERAELYEAKTSEEIVNEQTYTFTDRGDRRVTLRPEMTPTLARLVAQRRRELVFPLRWFNIGNRFRYERPQRGRQREFYQIDVDIVGVDGSEAEGEVLVLAHELIRSLGASDGDYTIRVNSRSLLNAAVASLGLSEEEATAYLALLDRKDKMSAEEFEERRSPFRRDGRDPLEAVEAASDELVATEREKLLGLLEALRARGITNTLFDPTVVRGFLYYTGIVFEVFDTNPENPRALLGGGRYDGLVALFGGEPIPAVGFAAGVTTLLDFMETHSLSLDAHSAPDVMVGIPNAEDRAAAQTFASELRERGLRVLVYTGSKSLGDQVKEAVRRDIPFFIAFGQEEAATGSVKVKALQTSIETIATREEAALIITPQ